MPAIIPKHELMCQPAAKTANPVEIEIFEGIEGRTDGRIVSRKLQMVSLSQAIAHENHCLKTYVAWCRHTNPKQ